MSDWISANTHPPKYGYYITWDGMNVREALWKSDHWSGIRFYDRIIHWKCLPPPPKKKHYCESLSWKCVDDGMGNLAAKSNGSSFILCNFCPICGEPASGEKA